ncbi:hypothetical protein GGI04_005261, partial [Coemansia thaxteri]
DNRNLRKGFLIGVFEVELTGMGSGANSIEDIHLVPTNEGDIADNVGLSTLPHSGGGLDALVDAFWFNSQEVEQMLINCLGSQMLNTELRAIALSTIEEWYDGYFIGRFRGKYNPWSVISYVKKLYDSCVASGPSSEAVVAKNVESAARVYWVRTGTTRLIDAYIKRHPAEVISLAEQLIREYEAFRYRPSESQDSAGTSESDLYVALLPTSLDVSKPLDGQFDGTAFLSLCLYGGYLTCRVSGTVCIPNQEVFMVWRDLFGQSVAGENMTTKLKRAPQGKLLIELWHGRTDFLSTLATSSHGVLTNHNKYREKDYANHAANSFLAAAMFGSLTHPDKSVAELSDVVVSRESHAGQGRSDCAMRLYSSQNQPNKFGLIIEFKHIAKTRLQDTDYHERRAVEGLDQITSQQYHSTLAGCLERMDVGMAVGSNVVYAKSRLYKRQTDE